jgi:protein involved in polysaccharide export with SLBB domain
VLLSRIKAGAVLVALGFSGAVASAQTALPAGSQVQARQFETRAQLEAQAAEADREHRTSEAWLLRSRLERGDFQEGDRIVVIMEGSTMVVDTMQVRSGKLIQFPRMGDLSLVGVLRSEVTEKIRTHLAQYLRAPAVRAIPLLPVAVLGSVPQPGFYYFPADVVLRDVVMRAGGPLGDADVNKAVIRRAGSIIWNASDVRTALADGLSLDALHLHAGDEIFVPQRRRMQASTMIAILSSTLALTVALTNLAR